MKNKVVFKLLLLVSFFLGLLPVAGLFNPADAAASLYMTASDTTVYPGQTFTVYPKVNTKGDATNAYTVVMSFSSSYLEVTSMSKGGSICSLYVSEPSHTSSSATISCGLPSPGYNGSAGKLGSITFKAKKKGTTTISITGSSKVLANDGLGTNILGSTGSLSVTITDPPPPPVGTPTITCSAGAQDKWYAINEATFSWTKPSGATGYSYIFTTNQSENPPWSNKGSGTSVDYSDLADGRHYFKVMATDGSRWGNVATFTLLIDNSKPKDLVIVSEPSNEGIIDRAPMISFNAVDEVSGIHHYEIKIDDGEYIVTTNPYQFEEITSGTHTITVKAVDNAGNFIEESIEITVIEISPPIIDKPRDGSYLRITDNLVIEGRSEPGSEVFLYLNGEFIAKVVADENGYFSYTLDRMLEKGDYLLTAVVKNSNGIISSPAEAEFTVDPYAIKIGGWVIPLKYYLTFFIFIILLIIFFFLFLLYKRRKRDKGDVKKDLKKARSKIDREVDKFGVGIKGEIAKVLGGAKVPKKVRKELEKKVGKRIAKVEKGIDKAVGAIPKASKQKEKMSIRRRLFLWFSKSDKKGGK